MIEYLKWEDINFTWDNLDMNWESILIEVADIIRRGGGADAYVNGNPWEKTRKELGEEKTNKFIKIFCKVNDLEYEKVIEPNSNIKVSVSQIEKVFNEVKINIKF